MAIFKCSCGKCAWNGAISCKTLVTSPHNHHHLPEIHEEMVVGVDVQGYPVDWNVQTRLGSHLRRLADGSAIPKSYSNHSRWCIQAYGTSYLSIIHLFLTNTHIVACVVAMYIFATWPLYSSTSDTTTNQSHAIQLIHTMGGIRNAPLEALSWLIPILAFGNHDIRLDREASSTLPTNSEIEMDDGDDDNDNDTKKKPSTRQSTRKRTATVALNTNASDSKAMIPGAPAPPTTTTGDPHLQEVQRTLVQLLTHTLNQATETANKVLIHQNAVSNISSVSTQVSVCFLKYVDRHIL
jgi:hypothetical protein